MLMQRERRPHYGNQPGSKVEDPPGWLAGPPVGMLAQCVRMIAVKIDIVEVHYWGNSFLCRLLHFLAITILF
jgi:hypothetical protein